MGFVKPTISFSALVGLLTFGASIGGWVPRSTGLISAGVALLLAFLYAVLIAHPPLVVAGSHVPDEGVRTAPAEAYSMVAVGPYSPRDLDATLQYAIASGRPDNLILVSGEPSSGKTRSAWTAVQATRPNALLFVADEPRYGRQPEDARPLEAAVATLEMSPFHVLWLDDAFLHVGRGLTASLLRELADRQVLVVATIQDSALDFLRLTDRELWTELRVKARMFRISAELSDTELGSLHESYRHLDPAEGRFLPSHLANVELLADRYRLAALDFPLGAAYVDAAWLWRAFGMPRHCPTPFLREIVDAIVGDRHGAVALDEADHRAAIEWATGGVDGAGALLVCDPFQTESYRSVDAVADLVDIPQDLGELTNVLSTVIAAARPADSLAVARATGVLMSYRSATTPTNSMNAIAEDTLLMELAKTLLPPIERDLT